MNINKILFVIMFCAMAQSAYVLSSEEKVQVQAAPPEAQQGWGSYLYNTASSAAAAAKRKAYQAAIATKNVMSSFSRDKVEREKPLQQRPSLGWRETPWTSTRGLEEFALSMVGTTGSLQLIANATNTPIKDIFKLLPKSNFAAGALGVSAVAGLLSFSAIRKVFDFLEIGQISENDAVERIKKCLDYYTSDEKAYPTVQSRIDALKNPESLLVFGKNENVIIYQACQQSINSLLKQQHVEKMRLQKEAADIKLESELRDEEINKAIKYYKNLLKGNTAWEKRDSMDKWTKKQLDNDPNPNVISYRAVEAQLVKQIGVEELWSKNPEFAEQRRQRDERIRDVQIQNRPLIQKQKMEALEDKKSRLIEEQEELAKEIESLKQRHAATMSKSWSKEAIGTPVEIVENDLEDIQVQREIVRQQIQANEEALENISQKIKQLQKMSLTEEAVEVAMRKKMRPEQIAEYINLKKTKEQLAKKVEEENERCKKMESGEYCSSPYIKRGFLNNRKELLNIRLSINALLFAVDQTNETTVRFLKEQENELKQAIQELNVQIGENERKMPIKKIDAV
jgi:hypothetical protein